MSKLLSIVIPFYKEGENEFFPLLSTISTQKGVDFSQLEVILVNDGYENYKPNTEFYDLFPHLYIDLLQMSENRGSGIARQVGLDSASGKYVMFCDCDDILHNVGIIGAMLLEMHATGTHCLSTNWLEESNHIEGQTSFIEHNIESTWLHGKMFDREFLVDNEIKFHDELRVHEDSYFLSLLTSLTDKRNHLATTSYIWTYKDNSITRKDNAIYTFDSMGVFVYAVTESIKNLIERGKVDTVEHKVVQLLCYIYLITQSSVWQEEKYKKYLDVMEKSLHDNMETLWNYYDNASKDIVSDIYWEEYCKSKRDLPTLSLEDWIEHIKSI